ncbi:MAG: porphobilinogen synthase [Simkaniaceae bacterium]
MAEMDLIKRPRRNRKNSEIRALVQETYLLKSDLVQPYFVIDGSQKKEPIKEMPEIERLSIDELILEVAPLHKMGLLAIALFPVIPASQRSEKGLEALNPKGLIPRAVKELKKALPSLLIITDIALDPYTTHGHDGLLNNRFEVDNDLTIETLKAQALVHARAGADIVAPSDMMDGRIGAIRKELDRAGYHQTSILSYTAKYASTLYSPFRSALKTPPAFKDKKSYQMNPANVREALLESALDESEGADILMIKPATLYLDVITKIRDTTFLPIAAYHVSGEYSLIAQSSSSFDKEALFFETLLSIKRAGADMIFSYAAKKMLLVL